MEDKFIELGGEKLKLIINFENCYKLTKYRNIAATGIDFSKASKKTIKEIQDFYSSATMKNGEYDVEDIAKLSPETQMFFAEAANEKSTVFSIDDIYSILTTMTGIDKEKAKELLDKEVQLNGFDGISEKLIVALNEVFPSAKGGQLQKAK